MSRVDFNHLQSFIIVARERSFTRAAAQLGVSQSALSHTIRGLETRLGVRLLSRTTRGVSPTEAGERLYATLAPHYEGIHSGISALSALREKPAGTVRISAYDHSVSTALWPRLAKLLAEYPDIKIEININYELIDIVAERYDAGVRFGDQVAKDMVAVRIAPDVRMAAVCAPAYLSGRVAPATPQELTSHRCIPMRLTTHGGLYAWEFEKDGHKLEVQVDGQIIFNTTPPMLQAVLDGAGVAFLPADMVRAHVAAGRLVSLLEDWCPVFPGYHLYYPSRRLSSPAFSLVMEALRVD